MVPSVGGSVAPSDECRLIAVRLSKNWEAPLNVVPVALVWLLSGALVFGSTFSRSANAQPAIPVQYVADDGSLYAAIWEKRDGPPYVARHDLTSQQYQSEFNRLVGAGYCLTDVSGYAVGAEDRYAAIWEQASCPPFVARHAMTSQQYQEVLNSLVSQGYRPKLVDGYTVAGSDRYAAIFEKSSGPAFVARHGMTGDEYQREFDRLASAGYCLTDLSGYSVGPEARYAAIWEQTGCASIVARSGLSSQQYQRTVDDLATRQGYREKLVSGYQVAGTARFAAIFDRSLRPQFVA